MMTLWIVDDDELVCRSLKRVVGTSGYSVEIFHSAEELLNAGSLNGCRCLILDVRLPAMNGLELQRQLHTRNLRFPIIFITSLADESVKAMAMQAGAIDYLHKPFGEDELLSAIRKAFTISQ
ncbi:MAG: response regulator [Acidobacteria bacterium]|nr:response regulator [Acidobacteriota bacterium]